MIYQITKGRLGYSTIGITFVIIIFSSISAFAQSDSEDCWLFLCWFQDLFKLSPEKPTEKDELTEEAEPKNEVVKKSESNEMIEIVSSKAIYSDSIFSAGFAIKESDELDEGKLGYIQAHWALGDGKGNNLRSDNVVISVTEKHGRDKATFRTDTDSNGIAWIGRSFTNEFQFAFDSTTYYLSVVSVDGKKPPTNQIKLTIPELDESSSSPCDTIYITLPTIDNTITTPVHIENAFESLPPLKFLDGIIQFAYGQGNPCPTGIVVDVLKSQKTVYAGDKYEFVVEVDNNYSGKIENVRVIFPKPLSGVSLIGFEENNMKKDFPELTFDMDDIGSGSGKQVKFFVQTDENLKEDKKIINLVKVTWDEKDPDGEYVDAEKLVRFPVPVLVNPCDIEDVVTCSDIMIGRYYPETTIIEHDVRPGQIIDVSDFGISNRGWDPSEDVLLSVSVPEGGTFSTTPGHALPYVFSNDDSSSDNTNTEVLKYDLKDIEANSFFSLPATITIKETTEIDQRLQFHFSVTSRAGTPDYNLENNEFTFVTHVQNFANLSYETKTVPEFVKPGEPFVLIITVKNTGSATSENLSLDLQLSESIPKISDRKVVPSKSNTKWTSCSREPVVVNAYEEDAKLLFNRLICALGDLKLNESVSLVVFASTEEGTPDGSLYNGIDIDTKGGDKEHQRFPLSFDIQIKDEPCPEPQTGIPSMNKETQKPLGFIFGIPLAYGAIIDELGKLPEEIKQKIKEIEEGDPCPTDTPFIEVYVSKKPTYTLGKIIETESLISAIKKDTRQEFTVHWQLSNRDVDESTWAYSNEDVTFQITTVSSTGNPKTVKTDSDGNVDLSVIGIPGVTYTISITTPELSGVVKSSASSLAQKLLPTNQLKWDSITVKIPELDSDKVSPVNPIKEFETEKKPSLSISPKCKSVNEEKLEKTLNLNRTPVCVSEKGIIAGSCGETFCTFYYKFINGNTGEPYSGPSSPYDNEVNVFWERLDTTDGFSNLFHDTMHVGGENNVKGGIWEKGGIIELDSIGSAWYVYVGDGDQIIREPKSDSN